MPDREQLTVIVAIAVTVVWVAATVFSMFTGDARPLAAVTSVMMLVGGFLFGWGRRNGK